MDELIRIFEILGDETRLRIIKILLEKESLCVCEIMQVLGTSQTRVSKHLRILKDAGLVKSKKKGLWVHYSISKNSSKNIKEILLFLKQILNDDRILINDKKRLAKAVKLSECKCKTTN
jgi:ArsR family transcriptional regulator, arsenate/arsenite/antimonite-responsive transcriptional repressor